MLLLSSPERYVVKYAWMDTLGELLEQMDRSLNHEVVDYSFQINLPTLLVVPVKQHLQLKWHYKTKLLDNYGGHVQFLIMQLLRLS